MTQTTHQCEDNTQQLANNNAVESSEGRWAEEVEEGVVPSVREDSWQGGSGQGFLEALTLLVCFSYFLLHWALQETVEACRPDRSLLTSAPRRAVMLQWQWHVLHGRKGSILNVSRGSAGIALNNGGGRRSLQLVSKSWGPKPRNQKLLLQIFCISCQQRLGHIVEGKTRFLKTACVIFLMYFSGNIMWWDAVSQTHWTALQQCRDRYCSFSTQLLLPLVWKPVQHQECLCGDTIRQCVMLSPFEWMSCVAPLGGGSLFTLAIQNTYKHSRLQRCENWFIPGGTPTFAKSSFPPAVTLISGPSMTICWQPV